jgi:hypothetical protein
MHPFVDNIFYGREISQLPRDFDIKCTEEREAVF